MIRTGVIWAWFVFVYAVLTHLYSPLSTTAVKISIFFRTLNAAHVLQSIRSVFTKKKKRKKKHCFENNFIIASINWAGFTSVVTSVFSPIQSFTGYRWRRGKSLSSCWLITMTTVPLSPSIARVSTRSQLPRDQVAEIRWSRPPGTPASWFGRIADITAAPPTPSLHLAQCASLRAQLQRSASLLLPTSGRWLMSLIELAFWDRSVNTTHEGVRDYSPNQSALVCA